jgi:anti-anti-sigma factor
MKNELGSDRPTMDVRWPRPGVAQVVLGGEHDLDSVDRLTALLMEALEDSSHLVVDLNSATFIDSSTIRALITTKGRADTDGRRFNVLLEANPTVERALEITAVLTALNRVHSFQEAVNETGRLPAAITRAKRPAQQPHPGDLPRRGTPGSLECST